MTSPFFYLHHEGPGGVAYAPRQLASDRLLDYQNVSECPFVLALRDGPDCDFQATNVGWRLFSLSATEILKHASTPRISWLRVNVEVGPDRHAPYYTPIFLEGVDVLQREESILVDDEFVVKVVLDPEKVNGFEFFPVAYDDFRLIVSHRLKEKLVQSEMSGFDYSPVAMRRSFYGKSYH